MPRGGSGARGRTGQATVLGCSEEVRRLKAGRGPGELGTGTAKAVPGLGRLWREGASISRCICDVIHATGTNGGGREGERGRRGPGPVAAGNWVTVEACKTRMERLMAMNDM